MINLFQVWAFLVYMAIAIFCNGSRSAVAQEAAYPTKPITIICPWAAGGGTDRVSRRIAMELERELEVPVNVINATGGKGVTGHSRGLSARPDGYTLTMMTFELNTMHWMHLTDLTYEDCIPLVSVNEDYAALLVSTDSPWKSLSTLTDTIRQSDTPLTASGTALGGAWHLALAGWLDSEGIAADKVTWIPSQGSSPSLQQLVSGGVDMVCCSLPEARPLLESETVVALGVMSEEPAIGFESVPTFGQQGSLWTLGGWRGLAVPVGTPEVIVARLRSTLHGIVSRSPDDEDSFANFMQQQKFDATWRAHDKFLEFMAENDRKLGKLLQSEAFASVSEDRFNPLLYPGILGACCLIALLAMTFAPGQVAPDRETDLQQSASASEARATPANVVLVVGGIACYVLFAETFGFVPLAFVLLVGLQWKLGVRMLIGLPISLAASLMIYIVFAWMLRVSLPAGFLGGM